MSEIQSAMVIEAVTHYKKKLLRHIDDDKSDVVLHCLAKLDRVPMTIEILQETGVGRVVNQLKKSTDPDSQVAEEAKNIVRKWKEIVSSQEEEEERMNAEQQAADSKGEGNTEEEAPTSSGPDDLEEEKLVPHDDSGSDIGPPTLEPQINSPPRKISKSSKHSSSKEKKHEKSDARTEKSHDGKVHQSRHRDDVKHKSHSVDKSASRSDKVKKQPTDDKNKEHKSKHKASKSHNELNMSRDLSKEGEGKRSESTERNGISRHSSSHHRDKSHRSSESNSSSSVSNHKRREKNKDKSSQSSQKNVSSENKGMFENAMLGADNVLSNKKSSNTRNGSEKDSIGYSNKSFENVQNPTDHPYRQTTSHGMNGNSLVNVSVPKDINPNYRPMNISNGAPSSSIQPHKLVNDLTDGYSGKKKMTRTQVYSGGGRRCVSYININIDIIITIKKWPQI